MYTILMPSDSPLAQPFVIVNSDDPGKAHVRLSLTRFQAHILVDHLKKVINQDLGRNPAREKVEHYFEPPAGVRARWNESNPSDINLGAPIKPGEQYFRSSDGMWTYKDGEAYKAAALDLANAAHEPPIAMYPDKIEIKATNWKYGHLPATAFRDQVLRKPADAPEETKPAEPAEPAEDATTWFQRVMGLE